MTDRMLERSSERPYDDKGGGELYKNKSNTLMKYLEHISAHTKTHVSCLEMNEHKQDDIRHILSMQCIH